jgi:hypothetical protein
MPIGSPLQPCVDNTPFGENLAKAVALRLHGGHRLHYDHRDFCGMGFACFHVAFYYVYVLDGLIEFPSTSASLLVRDERRFATVAEFVDWLAAQSDASLNGDGLQDSGYCGNQRVTRERLERFIAGENPRS